VHLAAKFHHPMLHRSEVIMSASKQTPLKTSTLLRYATPVGKQTDGQTDGRTYVTIPIA